MFLSTPIPCEHLRQLEFLLGDMVGSLGMNYPGSPPFEYSVVANASWEASERYIRIELFGRASSSVFESWVCMIGYSADAGVYRLWLFARTQSEPAVFEGHLESGKLVLVSGPTTAPWGTERLRLTLTPREDESFGIEADYWTPDGWFEYCHGSLRRKG